MNNRIEEISSPLEFRQFSSLWKSALAAFFRALEENGDIQYFHPHPFSEAFLDKLCSYQGRDLYYVAVESNRVFAYGLLRGWDEGYAVPSLGIAVHPKFRGTGFSRAFMHFLHTAARRKGAEEVRLKVYPENFKAIRLYESLGYIFQGFDDQQMVWRLTLK